MTARQARKYCQQIVNAKTSNEAMALEDVVASEVQTLNNMVQLAAREVMGFRGGDNAIESMVEKWRQTAMRMV